MRFAWSQGRRAIVMLCAASVVVAAIGFGNTEEASAVGSGTSGAFVPVTTFTAGSATLAAGATTNVQIAGAGGLPSTGVSAVVVDLAVTSSTSTSAYLTAWPTGETRPVVASMYFASNTGPRSNTAIVPVGSDGKISVYNSSGSTAMSVDVQGYFTAGSGKTTPGGYVPIQPTRVARSETGVGMTSGKVAVGAVRDIQVTGPGGIPSSASAVFANIEVKGATGAGAIKVGQGGQTLTSRPISMNYNGVSQTNSGLSVKLSTDGKLRVMNSQGSAIHITVDVHGYFTADPDHGGSFHPLTPTLVYSTASTGQVSLAANETREIKVRGVANIPDDTSVGAIALVVSVKNWTAGGYVTVWNADELSTPGTHNTSFTANAGAPAAGTSSSAIVAVSQAGKVKVRNGSTQPVTLNLAANGWFDASSDNQAPSLSLTETAVAPGSPVGGEYRAYSSTPVIQPIVNDEDGEDVRVRVRVTTGSTVVYDSSSPFVSSGTRAKVTMPQLTTGKAYTADLSADDGTTVSSPVKVRFKVTSPAGTVPSAVVSAADLPALARLVTDSRFPSGNDTALVTAASGQVASEGAAFASALDVPLVVGTDNLAQRLQTLGAEKVYLYGTSSTFSQSIKDELASSNRTIAGAVEYDAAPQRTAFAAAWTTGDATLLTSSDDQAWLGLAAATAASMRVPLVVQTAPSEAQPEPDNSAAKDLFGTGRFKKVIAVAKPDTLDTSMVQTSEDAVVDLQVVEGSLHEVSSALAEAAVGSGRSVKSIVVSAHSSAAVPLAGYLSANKSVFVLGGESETLLDQNESAAAAWVRRVGPELNKVTVVGTPAPSTYASNLGKFSEARAAASSTRVGSITETAGNTVIKVTGASGATQFKAYDVAGAVVATSSTSTLTIPGAESKSLRIVATAGTTVVADMEVRYTSLAENAEAGAWTSTIGSAHQVGWYSISATPRVVRRYTIDPAAADEVDVDNAGEVVAITCGQTLSDLTTDSTQQYRFEVSTMAPTGGAGCATSGETQPTGDDFAQGTVDVPPMDLGSASTLTAQATRVQQSKVGKSSIAARPSVMDALLRTTKDETGQLRAAGPGDDWLPFLIRYQGYIPKDKVTIPLAGPLFRPVVKLGGDGKNRLPSPKSSRYRFRMDVKFVFGSSPRVEVGRDHQASHMYHCRPWGDCALVKTETASNAGLKLLSSVMYPTGGSADIEIDSGVPVLPGWMAPNISSDLDYLLRAGGSRIVGRHDRMPSHEIWGGPVPGMFFPIHYKRMSNPGCLFPKVPKCSEKVSAKF